MDERPKIRPINEGSGKALNRDRAFLTLLGAAVLLAVVAVPVFGFLNFLQEKEIYGLPWE